MSKRIVIALGGNALGSTAAEQLALVSKTAKAIVDLIAEGNEVVIAHGNGPQVGMINLGLSTAAEAGAIKADMPFPECGAMSEGYIGYHLQQAIGNELTAVVNELKSIEDGDEEKGFLGLFKKGGNKIANMKAKYAKAEVNVDKICKVLEGHQIQLLKDAAMLDQMYQLNLTYYKELSMYILAGKEKIQQVKEQELPELIKRAEESGLPEDTQKAKDLAELCNRFEKKIYDLELTRTISMQMAPQIRLIQSNDTAMSEKIQSTLVNTIPLWKSQMVLAIGVEHSAQAAKAQREVTDMTNTLLKKNAETLKLATVETAKESERGIVDIETLKQTNETLISTLDEVLQIQEDGSVKSPIAKFFSEAHLANILKTAAAEPGDLILFVADKPAVVAQALGALRLEMAKRRELIDEDMLAFAWVVDFPMFEYNDEEKRYVAMHHPFTAPRNEDLAMLATDPGKVYAKAYDMVLNGTEIGGGSIRINTMELQERMLVALGFTPESAEERFGFLLEAFRYGAPPHGGMAFGLDRLVMLLLGKESIKEVIAFPKVQNASELMSGCPAEVEDKSLAELAIKVDLPQE